MYLFYSMIALAKEVNFRRTHAKLKKIGQIKPKHKH